MPDIMSIHEIVLPETKPETEWILGRAVQKVSPYYTHGRLQGDIYTALRNWCRGRGRVATEWRFRIAPPGEIRRPLVPDVAYVSNERLRALDERDLEAPPFAPDLAVEILSPGDHPHDLEHKTAVYFAGGASLVMVVDPSVRIVRLHDIKIEYTFRHDDVVQHPALPGFALWLAELFAPEPL